MGPWKHEWPTTGTPGPNYEWRRKALKWWDHWLKGIDNGVMSEPPFMVFMRDAVPPSEDITTTPGQWRCGNWPVGGIKERRFCPGENRRLASTSPDKAKPCTLVYKAGAGSGIHGWWGETSGDMSFDDQRSMVFDSPPLTAAVEIMGLPKISLTVSADAPLYQWSVRIEDVWPNEKVSLVTGTLINPADRESRLKQTPLIPGQKTKLSAEIHFTTWSFRPNHRIRISISNAQFPMAWPTPCKGSTKLYPGPDTHIDLPVVERNTLAAACDLPKPEKEEWPPDASYEEEDEGKSSYMEYDPETGASVYTCGINWKMTIGSTKYRMREKNTWKVNDNNPGRASYEAVTHYSIRPPGRELSLIGTFRMTSDEKNSYLTVTRELFEAKGPVRERKWRTTIPRKHQ